MLKILGEHYYLDLDKIDEYIQINQDSLSSSGETESTQINIVKYETIKLMLEVIMDVTDEIDETLAGKGSEISIPFKLAFNTLLNKKLLIIVIPFFVWVTSGWNWNPTTFSPTQEEVNPLEPNSVEVNSSSWLANMTW